MTIDRRAMLGAGAAGLMLVGFGAVALRNRATSPGAMTIEDVLHDPDNPVLGNPAGRLSIAEYFDYQCPFCKRDHALLTNIVAEDGDIRLVMKDWPIFGAASVLASRLVLGAAAAGDYARAHAALMATPGRLTEDQVRQVLAQGGVDIDAALDAYRAERDKWDGLLARNAAQAAALALGGTPGFIIGTTLYSGALGEAGLRTAITNARRMS